MTEEVEETVGTTNASVDDWENFLLKYQFDDFAKLRHDQKSTLVIDYEKVSHNRLLDLARQVQTDPERAHKAAGRAAFRIMRDHYHDYSNEVVYNYLDASESEPYMQVGFKNIPIQRQLSQINHEDLEKMCSIEGFIVSVDDPRPHLREKVYKCLDGECGQTSRLEVREGYVEQPKISKCMYCGSPKIIFDKAQSRYDSFQEIKLQEKQGRIEQGRIPMSKKVFLLGRDWLFSLRAGAYAVVNGTVKTYEKEMDYFIQASCCEEKKDDAVLYEEKIEISDATIEGWLEELGEEAFYQKLVRSVAPSIHGHELEKEALLLQMAGSDPYIKPDGTRHRGNIVIGMWGGPRTAKSMLAEFASRIYPRAEYVSGQVTDVGFTATLVHDKDKHIIRLEAGLYLLASSDIGGICVVDEVEKTDKNARKVLSGILDDKERVSIHKGPIHKDIDINCASVFIANPATGGGWNDNKDIYQNTLLEPWFLGRMDVQFIFRDIVNEERDRKIVRHYLSQFGQKRGGKQKDQAIFSVEELRAWFMYVRKNKHTTLLPNTQAAEEIEEIYLKLRKMSQNIVEAFGGDEEDEEDAAPYQRVTMADVGALVRFACARANAVLRNEMTLEDVKKAERIVEGSIASITFKGPTTSEERAEMGVLSKDDKKLIKTIDIQAIASKEYKQIEKKKQQQIRTFERCVRSLGFTKCRFCHARGTYYEAGAEHDCPQCDGVGGIVNALDISYIEGILKERGLTRTDVSDIATIFVRRGLIGRGKDGRYRINNITDFEIASKELAEERDEDILAQIPDGALSEYERKLKNERK